MIDLLLCIPALVVGAALGFCACATIARKGYLEGAWPNDKVEGLEADLDSAVEVAFKRGAKEWVRLNYPDIHKRLSTP